MKFLRSLPFWALLMVVLFSASTAQAAFGEDVCWKNSYGRHAGMIPDSCENGREKSGALCYQKCAPNRIGEGPGCWSACPAGFTDGGVFCYENAKKECPPTTIKTGIGTCTKTNEWRDAGVPMACGAGKQMDAGLCYSACRTGYQGVGPVCWGSCTDQTKVANSTLTFKVECGAMCANSADECAIATTNIVLSTLEMVGTMVSMVATGGAATAAKAAASTAVKLSLAAAEAGAKAATKNAVKKITSDVAKEALKKAAQKAGQTYSEAQLSNMSKASVGLDDVDWSMLDPTGIAGMVQAYDKPICGDANGQTTKTRNLMPGAIAFSPFDSFQYVDHSGRKRSVKQPKVERDMVASKLPPLSAPNYATEVQRMEARLATERAEGKVSLLLIEDDRGTGASFDLIEYTAPSGEAYVGQVDVDGFWIHQRKADFEVWLKANKKGPRLRAHRDNIIHYKSWDAKFYQAAWNGELKRWQIKAL
jgi:hypothetical protein